MAINKVIGYVLSLVGLAGIVLSSGKVNANIPILSTLPANTIMIISGILVVAGIAILIVTEKTTHSAKQAGDEVPIYEGSGKKRKIVGYQRK